jgi:hypothetical protein
MMSPISKALILLAIAAGLNLGTSVAIAQATDAPQQARSAFKGIHRNLGRNGAPDTVTITDGKTYTRVTEQEYRERGYAPELHDLPTVIVQRLPVRIPIPPDDRN